MAEDKKITEETQTTPTPTEPTTLAEYLAAANLAEQTAANNDLAAAATAYKTWSDKAPSAYQKLLESQKPKDNSEKIERNRRMAKTNAYTDFFTALASGLIGSAWKGYAPKINDNASPYIAELKNLQQLNNARNEKYKQLEGQVELSKWEQEGKTALANYEAAKERARKAEERGWEIKKMAAQQAHQKQLNNDKIQGANDRAQAVAAAKNKGKKQPYLIGPYDISPERLKTLRAKYGEWVQANVPAFEEIENKLGIIGEPVELRTQKTSISDDEFADWLNKNSRNQIIAAFLNNLAGDPESGVTINEGRKSIEEEVEIPQTSLSDDKYVDLLNKYSDNPLIKTVLNVLTKKQESGGGKNSTGQPKTANWEQ